MAKTTMRTYDPIRHLEPVVVWHQQGGSAKGRLSPRTQLLDRKGER
jgi:hypothetical protein